MSFAICKSVKRGNGIEVIEDILPIYNVELAIKTDKKINKVYLAPQKGRYRFYL